MLHGFLHSFYIIGTAALLASAALGKTSRYESGLLSRFDSENQIADRSDEATAVRRFIDENFGSADRAFEWRMERVNRDLTHSHFVYQLYYEDTPVAEHVLKVHYRREGWVEYASSSWEKSFRVDLPPPSRERSALVEETVRRRLFRQRGVRELSLEMKPVIWVAPEGTAHAAFDVTASALAAGYVGRFYVEANEGKLLAEMHATRSLDQANKAYKKSPFPAVSPDAITLTGLNSADTLSNAAIRVVRHENEAAPRMIDISAKTVFADDVGFSTSPGSFSPTCGATSSSNDPTKCPNQGFDGVNIYYHVQSYRDRLTELFTALGTTSAVLRNDPLPLIVNAFVDTDGDGQNDTNNALYVPSGCISGASPSGCIVFVRPEAGKLSSCGSGTITFFDPAREAVVLVHEYQHYVTDMISGMLGSSTANVVVVADALHEGYSDYFGTSEVSRVAGTDVTLVGQYFLQNCAPLQREIGTILPFANSSADLDPHYSGISWASGLWRIRQQLGADAADKIALKSLFFIPTQPGFFDAVESLVKADKALNAGANVPFIRDLYYNQIKFLGGQTPPFDPITKFIDVGFSGCGAVGRPSSATGGWLSLLLWLLGTVSAGRLRKRRVHP